MPTFFVSPDGFLGATFAGKFGVETGGDDDFIGFVFGYSSPLAGDPVNAAEYILFDWKQGTQSGARRKVFGWAMYPGNTMAALAQVTSCGTKCLNPVLHSPSLAIRW